MGVTAIDHPDYLPPTEPWTEPFWTALADGRLLLAWCDGCSSAAYPPLDEVCSACGRQQVWRDASGRGRLWSWTTIHREYVADYPLAPPYTVLMIDLPEGVRMLATLADGVEAGDLDPDAPVVFEPRTLAPGVIVPGFRPTR